MLRPLSAAVLTLGLFTAALAWQEPAPAPRSFPDPLPLASAPPQYWKGNLHTHSLWSDGDDFPEMIADWYKSHGYHFLALTEHNVIAEGEKWAPADSNATRKFALKKYRTRFGERWVETRTKDGKEQVRLKPLSEFAPLLNDAGKFLMIAGEEITHSYAKRPIHMNAVNLRDTIKPLDGKDAVETIGVNLRQVDDQRKKVGRVMVAFLNHPNFGWGVRGEELLMVPELRYFEVFNGHPGVRNYGDAEHASTERIWDITLALRLGKYDQPVVYGMATDDSHAYHEIGLGKTNPGRGWVMVKAPHLSPEAIVKGIERGDFYCSSGVLFDEVVSDGKQLKLAIRTEPGVTYRTEFVATMKDAKLDPLPPKLDKNGKPMDVTRTYSADIGKVVATSTAATTTYTFTGNELYVRAKVTSSKPHPNPYAKGDTEVAWTQPAVPGK